MAHETPLDWEQIYWEFLPRIYNFMLYKGGDRALAEDLTSQTFLEVWRCRERYDTAKGSLSTWIFTIARRTIIGHYRAQQRRDLPLTAAEQRAGEHAVIDVVEQRESIAELVVHLRTLAEHDHDLVALKYGAQMTNREIAQLTGLSESNVGTRLHRIIERLRSALGVEKA